MCSGSVSKAKLQKYIKDGGHKATPWAVANKIAPSVISRFLNGKGISKDNALKVVIATGGKVTLEELLFPE